MVGTLRKLVWAFEFWNEMLVSNIRCKNLSKKAEFQSVFTRVLRREGWKINDLSPLSWQFFEISWPLGCFQRLRVLKRIFVSRKLKYLNFDIMKCSSFLNLVFRKRHVIAELDCVFVLAIRGLLHMIKNFVLWCDFCVLITVMESFEKFSLKKSWCCRKHMFVFEIVPLKGLNKFLIKLSFPFDCWVKDLLAIMEKSLKTFPFWELTFFCKKVKLLYFGRVTFASSLSKGLNVLAIFKSVGKKLRYLARGR
jgi:hypothetical protein